MSTKRYFRVLKQEKRGAPTGVTLRNGIAKVGQVFTADALLTPETQLNSLLGLDEDGKKLKGKDRDGKEIDIDPRIEEVVISEDKNGYEKKTKGRGRPAGGGGNDGDGGKK
jgi:hypothetical protein